MEMMGAKIAIFHWGELSVHTYYLAEQLINDGIVVDFYLYTPIYAYKTPHSGVLLENFRKKKITVFEFRCTRLEAFLIKSNKVGELVKRPSPALFTNFLLPFHTRKFFEARNYKNIITITQPSLYWLHKTDPSSLVRAIHYSLEVEQITDPNIKAHSNQYAIIQKETKLLKHVKGLIMQDRMRAEALLRSSSFRDDLKIFYIPVSIPGDVITAHCDYLTKRFKLDAHQNIILYFGAVYQERKIDEVADVFARICNRDWVLVIHGAGEFSHLGKAPNIKTSNVLLNYDDLHLIISSAKIGIALYDNGWANTRLTAFSSEKIARYLQAGVPFIAFRNESYLLLQSEFDCCYLINDVSELEQAIDILMSDYERYRNNCYKAYNKYYNIEHSIKPLIEFLKS